MSYTFQSRCADQPDSADHALQPTGWRARPRHLRPGSMAGEPVDADPRVAFRPLRRLRPGAECARRDGRSKFEQSYPGVLGAPTFGNQWIGPRSFDRVDDVPNWKDLNPRVGGSYDLFGNGRTALKVSARPLRGQDQRRRAAVVEPDQHLGELDDSRRGTTLSAPAIRAAVTSCPIATSATSPPTANAARSISCRSSARPIRTPSAGPMRCARAGACATAIGTSRPRSSTSCARACR